MKLSKDVVLEYMQKQVLATQEEVHFTTQQLSEALQMQRSNLSKLLNELAKENRVKKTNGRPVYYSLVKEKDQSCFQTMIGSDGSLKQTVQLIKAALMYPGHSLPLLITGPDGSGKSLLAKLIYEYAKENHVIDDEAPFVKINCKYLAEESNEKIRDIFLSEEFGAMKRAQGGVLFIDHINRLYHDIQNLLLNYVEMAQNSSSNMILVYSIDDSINPSYLSLYRSKFSVVIDLPSLANRTFEERLDLIQLFFQREVECIHKNIKINSEVLRCLMLYPCQLNIKQLRMDIQLGCANGYARNFDKEDSQIELNIHDFPNYVRKGFLSYRKYRTQIEQIIPDNYLYSFSSQEMNASQDENAIASDDNYYNMIDRKVEELKSHGVEDQDIMTILHADLDYGFQKLNTNIEQKEIDKDIIAKVVDPKIIGLVDQFLKDASIRFDRIYSNSVFYGMCLHLSAMIERQGTSQKMTNEQIVTAIKMYNEEYIFCSKFTSLLEKEFDIKIAIDEVVFLSMFISREQIEEIQEPKPVVLVAMHGNSTASSIVEVANTLVNEGNIFSFDLSLDKDMQKVYEELSETIVEIHQGKGILMLYDMGSLKTMAEMISKETGINIKTFCIPATLIALDCSRKASCHNSLDDIYNDVMNSYQSMYPEIEQSYQKQEKPQVIISLCMTGDGAAVQIKNYIEQHVYLENTEIIPMAISDHEYLLKKVNQIQKNQKVICVIGVYDPKLYGIPYIPISKLFDTSPDKLELLLSSSSVESVMSVNYDAIYEYLKEELVGFDFDLLKEVLPKTIMKIRKVTHGLSSDQEVGLFMHLACATYRLQNDERSTRNVNAKELISKNKRLYNDLCEVLSLIEDEFYIKFDDNEIAYIIQIIKKC
ncbi:PRD domain-containing protein [Allobaculum stercoricanis]|uniref:PRD domain-containing protein n=1 Tax=Allobaculum stercoricanis TaxID=174709 RepID=UPI0023F55E3D|nr:PRD domain-containing protein [Allobaculum stercoricanis]